MEKVDVAIVGAGPAGLACGIEAERNGASYMIVEKGCLVNSIFHYPRDMVFFTTADLLEIGDVAWVFSPSEKPRRHDGLDYYRRVVDRWNLNIRDYTRVLSVDGQKDRFRLMLKPEDLNGNSSVEMIEARRVILAIGYYDNPNYIGIPGEDLPKVSHYFDEVHPFFRKKVAVIGAKNSAAQAALLLYRSGAEVTLIHRGAELSTQIKYWILPDIQNRIKNKQVRALFNTVVTRIEPKRIWVRTGEEEEALENDYVFALTGYHPDNDFMSRIGVAIDPETCAPQHDPETLETNVPGIYVAGGMVSGKFTNKIFIENGRFHGTQIFDSPGFRDIGRR
ncbi:MAG TPA: YpdA family putative bacillithiol disulfide reductase [Acidobacteriota bacterium]|jgi:thioredoxin reductase (NADPH)